MADVAGLEIAFIAHRSAALLVTLGHLVTHLSDSDRLKTTSMLKRPQALSGLILGI